MASFLILHGFIAFLSTALSIWSIVCMWIIFKKAWREWWESLIPIWNIYILFKIAGKTSYFWVLVALPILMIIYYALSWTILSWDNSLIQIFGIVLSGCYFIIPLICWLELPYWLTKKFEQSNWFYIGMLFLTPIFFWILAFGDAKYEWVEFNEKYNLKKWLLITLWVSLLIWCCNAWIKYYKYKDFYYMFYDFEYNDYNDSKFEDDNFEDNYEIRVENNDIENNVNEGDIYEELYENYDLKEDLLIIPNEVKDEIKDNDSKESEEPRINYNDIKKEDSWYKPTNKKWIDDIAKDYKWNIIMWSDFVDATKDWFYSVYTELTKRTLYINEEFGFILKIWPEKVGYTMEIHYNDIGEPDAISFLDKERKLVGEIYIAPREDCKTTISSTDFIWHASNSCFFGLYDIDGSMSAWIDLFTDLQNLEDYDTFEKLKKDNCRI